MSESHTLVVKTQMFKTKTKTKFQDKESRSPKTKSTTPLVEKIKTHVTVKCAAIKMIIYSWSPFNDSTIEI